MGNYCKPARIEGRIVITQPPSAMCFPSLMETENEREMEERHYCWKHGCLHIRGESEPFNAQKWAEIILLKKKKRG